MSLDMEQSVKTSAAAYVWPVKELEALTPAQRECARDIVDAFHEAMDFGYEPMIIYAEPASRGTPVVLAKHPDEFYWARVFAGWDSSMEISKPESATWVPLPKDLRHPVGYFKRDLPLSKCAQRKVNKSTKKVPEVRPERQAGATAYIRTRYKEESKQQFEFECCDETGKGADLSHVTFVTGGSDTTKDADRIAQLAIAVDLHDRVVSSGALHFNAEYLVYLMRCRLLRVLADAVPPGLFQQRPPNPTASDLSSFWRPQLIEMLLMKRPSTGERAWIQECLAQFRLQDAKAVLSMYDKRG